MPIYEYKCQKCGEKFEIYRNIFQRNETKCPKCGEKEKVERVYSPAYGSRSSSSTTSCSRPSNTFFGGG